MIRVEQVTVWCELATCGDPADCERFRIALWEGF